MKPDDIYSREELRLIIKDPRYAEAAAEWHRGKAQVAANRAKLDNLSADIDAALWAVRDELIAEMRAAQVAS